MGVLTLNQLRCLEQLLSLRMVSRLSWRVLLSRSPAPLRVGAQSCLSVALWSFLKAARPLTFRASRTARSANIGGRTKTGSSSRSMRQDAGQGRADRRSRPVGTPGRRTKATGRPPQSRRQSWGRTTTPGRQPAARSRSRRSARPQRSPFARPRRVWPRPQHVRRRARVPALGGLDPRRKRTEEKRWTTRCGGLLHSAAVDRFNCKVDRCVRRVAESVCQIDRSLSVE